MRSATVDTRAITSLAVLRVNWDEEGRDYLENFFPFLNEVLRASTEDRVSLADVSRQMRALVGFELPPGVVKTLLRRAAKRGYVRAQNNVFYVQRATLPSEPLAKREGDLRRECEALVGKLQAFAREQFGLSWSGEEAEHALFGVVQSFAAPLLHAARQGERPVAPVGEDQRELYVAARFVEHAYDRDPTAFAYLESVATGAVLASAVYHEDPSAVAERFDGLTAYLDTPLVLDALGVNGALVRVPIVEMISLMREQGVEVLMLRGTFDETQGVLDAHGGMTGDRRNEVGRGPVRGSMSPSDARMLSAQLDDRLSELKVRVVDRPAYDRRYGVDESALETRLQEAIDYVNPGARLHDVQALLTVYALRKGQRPSRLERAAAVFVTTNATLAKAAHWFFHDEHGKETVRAPICVTADDLSTRLWLKTPNEAPELPTRQLLARAYAAYQPSDALLGKYLAETDRLRAAGTVSNQDYLLMRSSDDLLRRVTEATLNDPDAFTEGTFDEIRQREMETVRAAASARIERSEAARLAAERKAEALQTDVESARAEAERASAVRADQDAAFARERAARESADTARERLQTKASRQREGIDRVARGAGTAVRVVVWALVASVLVWGALLTIPSLPTWLTGPARLLGVTAVVALLLATVVSSFTNAQDWAARLGRTVEGVVRTRLEAWMHLSEDDT